MPHHAADIAYLRFKPQRVSLVDTIYEVLARIQRKERMCAVNDAIHTFPKDHICWLRYFRSRCRKFDAKPVPVLPILLCGIFIKDTSRKRNANRKLEVNQMQP